MVSPGIWQYWGYMGWGGLGTLMVGGDVHEGFGHFKLRSGKSETCLAFEFSHSRPFWGKGTVGKTFAG